MPDLVRIISKKMEKKNNTHTAADIATLCVCVCVCALQLDMKYIHQNMRHGIKHNSRLSRSDGYGRVPQSQYVDSAPKYKTPRLDERSVQSLVNLVDAGDNDFRTSSVQGENLHGDIVLIKKKKTH